MVQSGGNERLTAFVSTVVAVAILAAGVTAHQNSAPEVTNVVQLGSDLRFQFEMGLRHNEREREKRLSELDAVMADWQASTQSNADREILVMWLQEAGASSLSGAMRDLPMRPNFSRVQPPAEHKVMKPVIPATPAQSQAEVAIVVETMREETPVTPTTADVLEEEEVVELSQPQSLITGNRALPVARTLEVAPRPPVHEEPHLVEDNLLTSVAVSPKIAEPVGVNLTELSARIAGYHEGLNEIDTALLRMKTASLDVVADQVKRLDSMTRDYSFVHLYYESLTDAERRRVLSPRSMESTISAVALQLNRCEEVLDGDFLGTFDKSAEEEIAALRTKLAEIRERVGP